MPDFASASEEALSLGVAAVMSGAQFLLLPEYCGGLCTSGAAFAPPHAAEDQHPVLETLRDFAAKNGVWILAGSVAITAPNGKFYNRSVMIDDAGRIASRYDKIHLFDVNISEAETYRESALVEPGDQAVLVDTPFGRIGHSICYDIRFPQLYRDMAHAGADMAVIPAAFAVTTGKAHWHLLNRARAVENGMFVVSPCAIGAVDGGGASYGHSLVVGPWGEVIADGGDIPGVVQTQIDLDRVADARGRVASLTHDRDYSLVIPQTQKRGAA